jgi:hypothetical protein
MKPKREGISFASWQGIEAQRAVRQSITFKRKAAGLAL